MNRRDHILILSSGLLSAPKSQTLPLLESFSAYYIFDEIAKPGFVSIGGDLDGKRQPFVQWLQALQDEEIKEASFEGADGLTLRITTGRTSRSFVLRTILSPDYLLRPEGLVELLGAQIQPQPLWERVSGLINESNGLDHGAIRDISAYILDPENRDVFYSLLDTLIEEIQAEYQRLDIPFRIPPSLESCFFKPGPSLFYLEDTDQDFGLENEKWHLTPITYGWELYYFEAIDAPDRSPSIPLPMLNAAFQTQLEKITAFAGKIKSPVKEAFLLGNYFLNTPAFSPLLDEAHLEAILHDLEEKGFSEQALENTRNIYETSAPFYHEGWPAQRIYGLFAFDISDVFGGMGSWNDMAMESDEDYAEHQQLSTDTYAAMKAYFTGLLSFNS